MAKKIVLDNPHIRVPAATEYTLRRLTVEYFNDSVVVELDDNTGQTLLLTLNSIPNTTQENAILALINNGVLSGNITDV